MPMTPTVKINKPLPYPGACVVVHILVHLPGIAVVEVPVYVMSMMFGWGPHPPPWHQGHQRTPSSQCQSTVFPVSVLWQPGMKHVICCIEKFDVVYQLFSQRTLHVQTWHSFFNQVRWEFRKSLDNWIGTHATQHGLRAVDSHAWTKPFLVGLESFSTT